MNEIFKPTVVIAKLSGEEQKVCKPCLAKGLSTNIPFCKLALSEESLNRIPTYHKVRMDNLGEKIDLDLIPEACPNKYKSASS